MELNKKSLVTARGVPCNTKVLITVGFALWDSPVLKCTLGVEYVRMHFHFGMNGMKKIGGAAKSYSLL